MDINNLVLEEFEREKKAGNLVLTSYNDNNNFAQVVGDSSFLQNLQIKNSKKANGRENVLNIKQNPNTLRIFDTRLGYIKENRSLNKNSEVAYDTYQLNVKEVQDEFSLNRMGIDSRHLKR